MSWVFRPKVTRESSLSDEKVVSFDSIDGNRGLAESRVLWNCSRLRGGGRECEGDMGEGAGITKKILRKGTKR